MAYAWASVKEKPAGLAEGPIIPPQACAPFQICQGNRHTWMACRSETIYIAAVHSTAAANLIVQVRKVNRLASHGVGAVIKVADLAIGHE